MKRIDVSTRKNPNLFAIVDDQDFEWLSQWKWTAERRPGAAGFYAFRTEDRGGKKCTVRMHRLIMGNPAGKQVDHIDGWGLNNTRANLRLASNAQNQHNSGPKGAGRRFKGAYWSEPAQGWVSHICAHGEHRHLGIFDTEEAAAAAYNLAAVKCHGAFARLNPGLNLSAEEIERQRHPQLRGEVNRSAKLSAEKVRQIRAAVGSQSQIAARFGVSQTNVGQIRRRKTWAHID